MSSVFQNSKYPYELNQTDKVWLSEVQHLIVDNLHQSNYGLKTLSKQIGVSESKLLYKIKKLTGFTPKKYINEIRLITAEQLLIDEVYPSVAEVCYAVGFQKPTYFSKLFKKRFEKSPSHYIQNSKERKYF